LRYNVLASKTVESKGVKNAKGLAVTVSLADDDDEIVADADDDGDDDCDSLAVVFSARSRPNQGSSTV